MDLAWHLRMMARYHAWATRRLFAAVDGLDDTAYRDRAGLFFEGIHGTLNHLLAVEILWRERLFQAPRTIASLDQEVHADRDALRNALLACVDEWAGIADGMDAATLGERFAYHSLDGQAHRMPRAVCLAHVFNHATHHRGQASAAVTAKGGQAPVMDLPYFLLEQPGGFG